jgi:ABC-type dipeptide/oligopeptide/nickel transport system ATPase subunit
VTVIEQAAARVILRTEHLSRVAQGVAIVNHVSLEVFRGELLGIVGASTTNVP